MAWDKTKPAATTSLANSNPEILANWAQIEAVIKSIADSAKFSVDVNGQILHLTQSGLTAHAGGGQALATQITADIAEVATVATGGDSVLLPVAKAGMQIIVINHGVNSMDVFPSTGEQINEAAADTAKACAADATLLCNCWSDGQWEALTLAR